MKPHVTYFIINRPFLRINIKQLKNGDYSIVYLTIVLLIKQFRRYFLTFLLIPLVEAVSEFFFNYINYITFYNYILLNFQVFILKYHIRAFLIRKKCQTNKLDLVFLEQFAKYVIF